MPEIPNIPQDKSFFADTKVLLAERERALARVKELEDELATVRREQDAVFVYVKGLRQALLKVKTVLTGLAPLHSAHVTIDVALKRTPPLTLAALEEGAD